MVKCIGLASGIGAGNQGCGSGPLFLKQNLSLGIELDWHHVVEPQNMLSCKYEMLSDLNSRYAEASKYLAFNYPFFLSFGGDHSSAIGTWSGVAIANEEKGDIGLIWIDAHMDSHTPLTSESGNIHGMPLATILGHGDPRLVNILSDKPKIKPENCFLIGIRSFEAGEAKLLKELNVRVYYIEEVHERGFSVILEEVLNTLSKRTIGYGVSFDLDSIDPSAVNAVGTPVPNGIKAEDAIDAMKLIAKQPPLAFELVEYNPQLDKNLETLKFTEKLLRSLLVAVKQDLNV